MRKGKKESNRFKGFIFLSPFSIYGGMIMNTYYTLFMCFCQAKNTRSEYILHQVLISSPTFLVGSSLASYLLHHLNNASLPDILHVFKYLQEKHLSPLMKKGAIITITLIPEKSQRKESFGNTSYT